MAFFLRFLTGCSFYQDYPPQLVDLQRQYWDPLLSWARTTFDVKIDIFTSILLNSQPAETKQKLATVLADFDSWEMAGTNFNYHHFQHSILNYCQAMERATYTTKSFIIALAIVKKHLTAEEASLAAQVEVASQIQRWGEVEDSE